MVLDILSSAIPFFFVAAVVYGALEVSGVFENKNVKTVISVVFAFFTLTYEPLVVFINNIMPYAAIFFIGIFFISFIFRPMKGGDKEGRDYTLIVIVCGLVLVFLANSGYDLLKQWIPQISGTNFIVAVGIILIVFIFYAAYKLGTEGQRA